MRRKTYGVIGLMEWHCVIDNGQGVRLHVPFSGGYENKFGIQPATYVTNNPVVQHIIENSDYYQRGRIVLLHDDMLGRREPQPESKAASPSDDGLDLSAMGMDGAVSSSSAPDDAKYADGNTDEAGSGSVIDVTSLDDCKRYLNSKYGIAVRNLRSKNQIMQEASALGITFRGI